MVKLLRNYLFKQFACALQEAYGLVGLGEAVVRLIGLVEDNDCGLFPQMDTSVEGGVEDVDEKLRSGGIGPGEQPVADFAGTRHRVVGHGLEGLSDVVGRDGCPLSGK